MLLTGQQIVPHLHLTTSYHKVNQVGVDLSVCKIEKIYGGVQVYKEKTIVKPENFEEIPLMDIDGRKVWRLHKGAYALTFNEGCKIPADATGFITSRSSIYRGGAKINSPIWDPGFETEQMGTTMIVSSESIFIEENARVGQFYMITNPTPDELYNGQFQGLTNY
jgi:dUTP pyrophosphatase